MGRFSPSGVTPNRSGEILGDALAEAVGNIVESRRRRRLDQQRDEDRDRAHTIEDAQMAHGTGPGINIQKPGELPPRFDVNVSGGPSTEEILRSALTPAEADAGTPRAASRPATVNGSAAPAQRMTGDMGSAITAALARSEGQQSAAPLDVSLSRRLSFGPSRGEGKSTYFVDEDVRDNARMQSAESTLYKTLAAALGRGQARELIDPGVTAQEHEKREAQTRHLGALADRAEQSPRAPQPRVLKANDGTYYTLSPDGEAEEVTAGGHPLRGPLNLGRGGRSGESSVHAETRQNAAAVRGQLSNTARDLAAARRGVPKRPAFFTSPSDSVSYEQRRQGAQGDVNRLLARSDSLTGVLDKLTGQMQGRSFHDAATPASGSLPQLTPRDRDRAASDPAFAAFLARKGYKLGGDQ